MRLALVLLLGASACAPRPEAHRDAQARFDAAEWLERARPTPRLYLDETLEAGMPGDSARARTAELDAAVGWERACDTYWSSDTRTFEHRPLDPTSAGRGVYRKRGVFTVTDIGPGEAVVTVLCASGAYLGAEHYVLVHIVGERAVLLDGQHLGTPRGAPSVYPTPTLGGSTTFTTLAIGRGFADCGRLSTYQIARLGVATLSEARRRTCDEADSLPHDTYDGPDVWPVVYPRP